jgi:aryl-alcohol dehydrogenase-like predicted oxidoreductase
METRKLGKTGQQSSLLIFGSFALFRLTQTEADKVIELAMKHGINQVDVSPLYGAAEERLGSYFKRHGKPFFLGCKTDEREKEGAWESIKRSLETLHADRFDLFQFHGVDSMEVLDIILGPGGAMEAVMEAQDQGLIGNIGITGHNPVFQNEALERFDFDTVMFPLNRVHAAAFNEWNDWRPLLEKARQREVGVMCIKSVAKQAWPGRDHKDYNTWYEPFDTPDDLRRSLRYTLSQDITAAVLPGESRLWPVLLETADTFKPLSAEEQAAAVTEVKTYRPLVGPRMD